MSEVKAQMRGPQHPLNLLMTDFKKFFKEKYSPFFNKAQFESREEAVRRLSLAIKAQDITLREQFPCDDHDEDDYQFDFAEQVLGEVKKFTVLLLLSAVKFYEPCVSDLRIDLTMFNDKMMAFILKFIFAEGSSTLYKVCHSMCRFETIQDEHDFATLMSYHGNTLMPKECKIAPWFCLNKNSKKTVSSESNAGNNLPNQSKTI